MSQESLSGQETMGGGGGSSSSLTLAQLYANGVGASDSIATLDATRGGVVFDGTGVNVDPVTVKNGKAGSGYVAQVTGSARTGYTLNSSGAVQKAAFGLAVSADDWLTGAAANDAVVAVASGGKLHLGALAAAAAVLVVNTTISVASAAGATLDSVSVNSQTVTITGNTGITAATGFNYFNISAPTYSAASGPAITNAATFVIQGPPALAGASAPVVTNLTALKVNGTWTNTVNSGHALRIVPTFAPTSGNGAFNVFGAGYTINQTGGANGAITGLLLNATETAVVGTHLFVDFQVGGSSRFKVANSGATTIDCTSTASAVPILVKNGLAGSGYEAQVTGTARTGFLLRDSGGTAQAVFGYAVSANDWFTGAVAGDTVITFNSAKSVRFSSHGGANSKAILNLASGTSWQVADASSAVTSRAADSQASQARTTWANVGGKTVSVNIYGNSNTTCGITANDICTLETSSGASNLVIFTGGSLPIVFATNNLEQARFTNGVGLKMTSSRFEQAKGADVAAAGTLTLGTDGSVFGITGTGTIDFITTTNWQAGSIITLRFAAAATVNHNTASPPGSTAPVLLSGSANVTFAANTILRLVYDGTNWIDVRKIA